METKYQIFKFWQFFLSGFSKKPDTKVRVLRLVPNFNSLVLTFYEVQIKSFDLFSVYSTGSFEARKYKIYSILCF